MLPYILIIISGGIGYAIGRHSGAQAAADAEGAGPIYTFGISEPKVTATLQVLVSAFAKAMGWDVKDIFDAGFMHGDQTTLTIAFKNTVKNPKLPQPGFTFNVAGESGDNITVKYVVQNPASVSAQAGPGAFS